jgi:hypothetical protein
MAQTISVFALDLWPAGMKLSVPVKTYPMLGSHKVASLLANKHTLRH